MSLVRRLGVLVLAVLMAAPRPHAQQPAAPAASTPAPEPTFRLRTDAVVVDVVVRGDGKRPVTGLTAGDFEIVEDGVRQQVTSFTARESRATRTTADQPDSTAPAASVRPDATIGDAGVVAVVFDRLTPEARWLAHRAARQFIGPGPDVPGVVGVFGIGLTLRMEQNFTRDYARISAAVDRLGQNQVLPYGSAQAQVRDLQAGGLGVLADGAVPPPLDATNPGQSLGDLQRMQLRMMLGFDMAERDFRSNITQEALLGVIDSMADVPGRKSLVLLSEGLDQGPSLRGRLQDVIDAANRANVAIYTIDAAGLRTVSPNEEARTMLNAAAVGGGSLAGVERFEALLMSTPAASLGRLALDTGGAYMESTNDLARIFTRVTEDMANHYVLTYVSTNATYDRRYRRIKVRVRRPGVTVSARHGYYAIPPSNGLVTHAWEAPAVSALEASRLSNTFPVYLERLVFPTEGDLSEVPLIVQADARHFRYDVDEERFRAEAVFLLRIRDINGQVLAKASDQYVLDGQAEHVEQSRGQTMLFYRQVALPPGTYVVEAVVHDVQADRASVRVGSLEVPRAPKGLPRVGSVFIVQHAQRGITSRAQVRSPLLHDGVLLYPNVGHAVPRGRADGVTFAFSVLPMGTALGTAQVELVRGRAVVGEAELVLDAAGSDGRIQQIASLPIAHLEPGTYDLRVRVPASGALLTRSTRFTVTP